eukprot:Hpha_TRINITY_DN2043_c0_g1::TRINITY_DN2043_c0_g1_i1::g.82865::m.82865
MADARPQQPPGGLPPRAPPVAQVTAVPSARAASIPLAQAAPAPPRPSVGSKTPPPQDVARQATGSSGGAGVGGLVSGRVSPGGGRGRGSVLSLAALRRVGSSASPVGGRGRGGPPLTPTGLGVKTPRGVTAGDGAQPAGVTAGDGAQPARAGGRASPLGIKINAKPGGRGTPPGARPPAIAALSRAAGVGRGSLPLPRPGTLRRPDEPAPKLAVAIKSPAAAKRPSHHPQEKRPPEKRPPPAPHPPSDSGRSDGERSGGDGEGEVAPLAPPRQESGVVPYQEGEANAAPAAAAPPLSPGSTQTPQPEDAERRSPSRSQGEVSVGGAGGRSHSEGSLREAAGHDGHDGVQ